MYAIIYMTLFGGVSMLDDFSLEQNIVYKTLINSVKNNKCSHAFLIAHI